MTTQSPPFPRRRSARAAWLVLTAISVAALADDASAQRVPGRGKGPEAKREGVLTDAREDLPEFACGDAVELKAAVADSELQCVLTMQKPLIEGMFTCVELLIDCDDKSATGLDGGHELRVRAAVGSRFEPNSAGQEGGRKKAIDHVRQSMTQIEDDGGGGRRWIHSAQQLPRPKVDGNRIEFHFPLRLIKERGDRYQSAFTIHARVDTSCSDQPIELLHVCGDEGLPIKVDGHDSEWSLNGVADPGDELHAAAKSLDLVMFRLEHDADWIYANARFQAPGFAEDVHPLDVHCNRRLTFHVEPQFPRYQDVATVVIPGGRNGNDGKANKVPWRSMAEDNVVEFAFKRTGGQSKYRVIAFSDYECVDIIDGELKLDWSK